LIADGRGRALVPRIGGSRCGLKNGQRVDHELKEWIDRGAQCPLKHAGSRHVAAGLARLGIKPLKAQVRVTDPDLKITTLIDAVGEGPDDTLWVIEVKTTTLNSAEHIRSYSSICKRTPIMRNGVTHTEQATHFLQAAFGALALRSLYCVHPDVAIKACVLVATATSCRTYVCPDKFLHRKLFHRRVPVPIRDKSQPKPLNEKGRAMLRKNKAAIWPAAGSPEEKRIDAALRQLGLARERRGMRRSVWKVYQRLPNDRLGKPVGVVGLFAKGVHRMTAKSKAEATKKLTTAAKQLLTKHPALKAAARLAVCARTYCVAPCPGPLGRV
jgi:hypothetical protein